MDDRAKDRRGDRRGSEWMCQGRIPMALYTDPKREPERGSVPCGGIQREELEDGTVRCQGCGHVDRRSTEGNRRAAEAELGALLRRIERELHSVSARVDAAKALNVDGRLLGLEESIAYTSARLDRKSSELVSVQDTLHRLENNVRDVGYRAEEAQHEAESAQRAANDARSTAERAGRGW